MSYYNYEESSDELHQCIRPELLHHMSSGDRWFGLSSSGRTGKENPPSEYLYGRKDASKNYPNASFQQQYLPLMSTQGANAQVPKPSSKRNHSRTTPIHRLPPEILGGIFSFCQRGWDSVSVESLMAVCATWMGVCLGTPSLWTTISVHMTHWETPNLYQLRSGYIHHHLSRSGILPLRVSINLVSRAGTRPRDQVRSAQAVLDILFTGGPTAKGASHWHSLHFSFDSKTPRRLLDFLGTSMPILHELAIDGPADTPMPLLQVPAVRSLSRTGCSEPAGHDPAKVESLKVSTTAFGCEEIDRIAAYTNLRRLSITVKKSGGRLPKLHLPKLTTLEITIKHTPSSNSLQIATEDPLSLRFLVLPRLKTFIIKGDNTSLISAATLRNLDQVRRIELHEWEFLANTSRRTKWGFPAYTVVQTPAMAWNPSTSVVEYLLSKCPGLEEFQGFPGVVKLVNSILHRKPELRTRLRLLQSRYQGVLKEVAIKGSA